MIHFSSQKIPLEDIYTPNLDLFPLSGPWVAMGWRTEDKSALFLLTGNRRPEQHLSSLIHYPPLHLAWLGLHTSSFGPFSGPVYTCTTRMRDTGIRNPNVCFS